MSRRGFLACASIALYLAAVPSLQVVLMAGFVGALTDADAFGDVAPWFLGLVVLIGFTTPMDALMSVQNGRMRDRISLRTHREVADTLASLPPYVLAEPSVAARIEAGNAASGELPVLWVHVASLSSRFLAVVGVVVTLAVLSPLAAVFILLALAPMLLAARRIARIDRDLWAGLGPLYRRGRYLHQQLISTSSSLELTSLGATSTVASMVGGTWEEVTARKARSYRPILAWRLFSGASTSVLLAAALGALVVGVHYGPAAAGGIYGVFAAMGDVDGLGGNMSTLVEANGPFARYRSLLSLRRPLERHRVAERAECLDVTGLEHTYPGAAAPAVTGVDLHLERGGIIALVGVNGAGKTTVVNAIVGALIPDSGRISIDGHTMQDTSFARWGGYFGVLTQEFGRYELTVRQSLLLGVPDGEADDERLRAALEAANAGEMVRALPQGLDQQLGTQEQGGTNLSGGQWQRLSLARIYLRNAPIRVLDEPTSAIDAESEQQVFSELQRTRGDYMTIVVSHRAWTLRGMDEILVLSGGHVVERGTYEELLARKGRFAEIFAEQAT